MRVRQSLTRFTALGMGAVVPSMAQGSAMPNIVGGVVLVLVLAVLAWDKAFARPRSTPLLWAGVGLVVAWVPSVMLSLDPVKSLEVWGRVVLLLLGGVAFYRFLVEDARRLDLALKALLVVTLAMAIYVALRFTLPESVQAALGLNLQYRFLTFKSAANLFMLQMPVCLWAGWRLGGRWRAVAVAAVVGGLVMLYGSDSRAAFSGVLFGLAAAGSAVAFAQKRWVVLGGVFGVILLGLWGIHAYTDGRYVSDLPGLWAPVWLIDPHRQYIWQFVFERFLEAPVFGHGPGMIHTVPGASALIPGVGGVYIPSHPHNWVVEILAETGLVGAVATFAAVAAGLLYALRLWLMEGTPLALALFTLLVMYWGAGLFNFSLWRAYWIIGLMVSVALLLAARTGERRHTLGDDP